MFEDYFFDKHANTCYKLFKVLKSMDATTFTVNKLSKQVGMPYQQTYNTYQDIMNDLAVMRGIDSDTVTDEYNFNALAADIHIETYRFFHLERSISFRFFNESFQNDGLDMDEFCESNGLSAFTVRRRVTPFREYLQSKQLQLDAGKWRLEGNELQIRMVLTSFYNEAFRGANWPFDDVTQVETKVLFDAINAKADNIAVPRVQIITKQTLTTLGVQLMRMKQQHFFTLNPRLQLVMRQYTALSELAFTPAFLPDYSERLLASERNYYYFTRISQLSWDSGDTIGFSQLRTYFRSFNNPINTFVGKLLDTLTTDLEPTAALHVLDDRVLVTNLFRIAYTYYVIDSTFAKPSDFGLVDPLMTPGQPLYEKVNTFIQEIPRDSEIHSYTRYLPNITESIMLALAADLRDFETHPLLNVRLELEIQNFITQDMFHILQDMNIIRILRDTSSVNPDVIITSMPNITNMVNTMDVAKLDQVFSPEIIYWNTDSQDADLYNLITHLQNLASAKQAGTATV